jgi:hypothetical protein
MPRNRGLSLKALLISLLVLHLVANPLAAYSQTGARKLSTVDLVQSIRKQYTAINQRARRFRKVQKELSGFSLEGGKLVAYFDGAAIVKLVATHYGESGRTLDEYYYANEKLIFVFHRESHYDRPLSGRIAHTYVNRFYFANHKLIEWSNTQGRPMPNGIDDYQREQEKYLETSRKFLEGVRSNAATIEA